MTTRDDITAWAEEEGIEDLILYDPSDIFDTAILGVARRFNSWFVVYDYDTVIDNLTADMASDTQPDADDLDPREEALDHFGFNVVGAWMGESTAAFLTRLPDAGHTTKPQWYCPGQDAEHWMKDYTNPDSECGYCHDTGHTL